MALDDFLQLVRDLVRDDDDRIISDDRLSALTMAVRRYSKDHPLLEVTDMVSIGGAYQALPDLWEKNFSQLKSIEYPLGDVPPRLLPATRWTLYNSASGQEVIISGGIPSGNTYRVSFNRQHVLDDSTDTIPTVNREPVACYAAAYLCEQLSSAYSGDSDSTIQADSVDHQDKGKDFAQRARSLRQRYFNELGVEPKRNNASGVVVDFDRADSRGGSRLFHRRR